MTTKYGTIKVQLGEPVSFIGVSYMPIDEGLFTGTAVSPKTTAAGVIARKSWKPEVYCTACRQPDRLESVLSIAQLV